MEVHTFSVMMIVMNVVLTITLRFEFYCIREQSRNRIVTTDKRLRLLVLSANRSIDSNLVMFYLIRMVSRGWSCC